MESHELFFIFVICILFLFISFGIVHTTIKRKYDNVIDRLSTLETKTQIAHDNDNILQISMDDNKEDYPEVLFIILSCLRYMRRNVIADVYINKYELYILKDWEDIDDLDAVTKLFKERVIGMHNVYVSDQKEFIHLKLDYPLGHITDTPYFVEIN